MANAALTGKMMLTAYAIGQNRRVNNLTAATALPGIEGANEIVILFSVHPSSAFWAFHVVTSLVMESKDRYCPSTDAQEVLHYLCQLPQAARVAATARGNNLLLFNILRLDGAL